MVHNSWRRMLHQMTSPITVLSLQILQDFYCRVVWSAASSSASTTSSSASFPTFAKQLCKLHKGNPCHTQFSASDIEDCRLQYLSLSQSREDCDIAILAKIECFIHTEDTIRSSKKCKTLSNKKRQKTRLQYCHHGHSIHCMQNIFHAHALHRHEENEPAPPPPKKGKQARRGH